MTAFAWLEMRQYDKAIPLYAGYLNQYVPEVRDVYFSDQAVDLDSASFKLAEQQLLDTLQLKGNHPQTLIMLGNIWMGRTGNPGYMTQAHHCFDRAIKLKPDYMEAWHHQGLAYVVDNNMEQAIAHLGHSISLHAQTQNSALVGYADFVASIYLISKDRLSKTVSPEAAHYKALFICASSQWQGEQTEPARDNLQRIKEDLNKLDASTLTREIRDVFAQMLALLPATMKQDERAQVLIRDIEWKLKNT